LKEILLFNPSIISNQFIPSLTVVSKNFYPPLCKLTISHFYLIKQLNLQRIFDFKRIHKKSSFFISTEATRIRRYVFG